MEQLLIVNQGEKMNLSEQKREKMLAFLAELKATHNDDQHLQAFNEIENALVSKKYGLVWEEHSENVEEMLTHHIPVLTEVKARQIISAEPSRAEPSRAEPSRAEPSRAEPSRAEPSRAEPSRAEPSRAEPSRAEPSRAEPSRAEPSRAEPSRAEPSR